MVEDTASKTCTCYLKRKLVAFPLLVPGSPASPIGGHQGLNSSNASFVGFEQGTNHCLMGLGGGSGSSRSYSSHDRGAKGRAEETHVTFPTNVSALSEFWQLLKCLCIMFIIVVHTGAKCCKRSSQKTYSPERRTVTHIYTIIWSNVVSPIGYPEQITGGSCGWKATWQCEALGRM